MTTNKNISIIGLINTTSLQTTNEVLSFSLPNYTHPITIQDDLKDSFLSEVSSKSTFKGIFKGVVSESFQTINNVTKKITEFIVTDYTSI